MQIKDIIHKFYDSFLARYAGKILPSQMKALTAMKHCRTAAAGEMYIRCSDCDHTAWQPMSCGHRSCPQCQNHETGRWIDRQKSKLLPVLYFMVTFTLPSEFRGITFRNQRQVYSLMFECVSSTLKDFGLNPKYLGADMGMTAVLHTHSRRLDYHPHIHVIVPGGGINKARRQWKKKKGKYLFKEKSLARVFRARFLDGLNKQGLPIPKGVRSKWIVNCKRVGTGITAVKYLARYLYRGVISEKNITANKNGQVTFKYVDSDTGETRDRTLDGEKFLRLLSLHVLPRGFRRVRDYGFLHGNAAKSLALVQLILHVKLPPSIHRPRPVFTCPFCKAHMIVIGVRPPGVKPG